MTYRGRVKNGVVVLDPAVDLPEGAEVKVELLSNEVARPTLGEKLMKYAGKAKGLPPDASRNLDRYLYGKPEE